MRKLIILGHAQHGKDTVAEYIAEKYNRVHVPASKFVCTEYIYPLLKQFYSSDTECYDDRVNNRPLWHELIKQYNSKDASRLIRAVFMTSDIYCGIRDQRELDSIMSYGQDVTLLWVDASERVPLESIDSMNIRKAKIMLNVDNNGSLEELYANIDEAMSNEV